MASSKDRTSLYPLSPTLIVAISVWVTGSSLNKFVVRAGPDSI
jgi:hypothetical protein